MSAELGAQIAKGMVEQMRPWIDAAVKSASTTLTAQFKAQTDALRETIAGLQKRLDEIPTPRDGVDGAPGAKGETGDVGPQGEKGLTGERGADGVNGADGAPGERGEKGDVGPQGERGDAGLQGESGSRGIAGNDGRSGESAYEIAVRKGFRGEESAWLESLAGDAGRDGRDIKGDPGKDGRDGADGFDLDDIKALAIDEDGNLTLRLDRDGRVKELSTRLPTLRFKGVFKIESEYRQGDSVTAGGSLFIARKDAPAGTPGNSDDWQLAVKRGRDAGRPAQRAVRPVEPYKIGSR